VTPNQGATPFAILLCRRLLNWSGAKAGSAAQVHMRNAMAAAAAAIFYADLPRPASSKTFSGTELELAIWLFNPFSPWLLACVWHLVPRRVERKQLTGRAGVGLLYAAICFFCHFLHL
jgi:hypothetical protein